MTTKHPPDPVAAVQPNNPLHGITLEAMLCELVSRHGWDGLGRRIEIRCFLNEPSIASSLKFLRRTPWARTQVEALYLAGAKPAVRQDESA
jgi:uncharacterized protein (DUF2132 family)